MIVTDIQSCRTGHIGRVLLFGSLIALFSTGLIAQSYAGLSMGNNNPTSAGAANQNAMSAETLINLLQRQPALLSYAKSRLAKDLGVDSSTLSDQVVFDRIRQDPTLRLRLTQGLQKRGYDRTAKMETQPETMGQSKQQPPFTNQSQLSNGAQTGNPSQYGSQVQADTRTLYGNPEQVGNQPQLSYPQSAAGPYDNRSAVCPQANDSQFSYGNQGSGSQMAMGCVPANGAPNALIPEFPQPQIQERQIPYTNLPSLRDLYAQMLPPPVNLKRFGSDVFILGTGNADSLPMDLPAGPDYVLGPGDVLAVNIWGSQSQTLSVTVDRQGQIALPDSGPATVAGMTIAQGQKAIEAALRMQYKTTHVEISLGRVRSVRVYVVGDVQRPGAYDISSLSTPLNALYAAGGPTSHGSLRALKHYRGKALLQEVDLYDFMLHGIRSDIERLLPGDTILVPPVGPQVTVNGMVKRPAIYELKGNQSLKDVLDMAGGTVVSANLQQITVERIEAHQRRTMLSLRVSPKTQLADSIGDTHRLEPQQPDTKAREIAPNGTGIVDVSATGTSPNAADVFPKDDAGILELANVPAQDGDIMKVLPILPYNQAAVYLDGHVFRPGKYPYRDGMTINDLLHSYEDVMPEPADHAELIRLQSPDYRPTTVTLNLPDVLRGNEPLLLQPFDTVRVFSRYEIDIPIVSIQGEVLRPGEYPLAKGMTASGLVKMAGGFKRSAYRNFADLSSYVVQNGEKVLTDHRTVDFATVMEGDTSQDVPLKPGDVLSIRQLTGWNDIGSSVTVNGEVGHAGTYGITEGERLSSVLKRAGGFRESAYPAGAVLERVQVRELGEKARLDLIQRIQSQNLSAMTSGASGALSAQEQAQSLQAMKQQQEQVLTALQNQPASGRLVIRINKNISEWENSQADVEMRAGDVLIIPKEAAFVLVSGQVYSPSALTYVPHKTAAWYLRRAGGPTNVGNKKDIFIVRADGSVIGRGGLLSEKVLSVRMSPGDSIVVPEKIFGPPWWKSMVSIAQIMSSTALTAAVATGL
jgi:protein involved in polysaccharide export with SLBB domain